MPKMFTALNASLLSLLSPRADLDRSLIIKLVRRRFRAFRQIGRKRIKW